jgi:type IV secretory pathway VirB2 component (pilin)
MIMNSLLTTLAQINIDGTDINIPKGANTATALENALQLLFGVAGAIAVIVVIVAGIQYMLSQGEPQKTAKAKDTILYALIGLVICIFAFNIVGFVVNKV